MNLVNPPVVAGAIGGICSAAVGLGYAAPAVAAVVASPIATVATAGAEAATEANALILEVVERTDPAALLNTAVCAA